METIKISMSLTYLLLSMTAFSQTKVFVTQGGEVHSSYNVEEDRKLTNLMAVACDPIIMRAHGLKSMNVSAKGFRKDEFIEHTLKVLSLGLGQLYDSLLQTWDQTVELNVTTINGKNYIVKNCHFNFLGNEEISGPGGYSVYIRDCEVPEEAKKELYTFMGNPWDSFSLSCSHEGTPIAGAKHINNSSQRKDINMGTSKKKNPVPKVKAE